MTKVYCNTKELIIVDKPPPKTSHNDATIQRKICGMIGGDIQRVYTAHEIWSYDIESETFESYKVRGGHGEPCLLIEFLASHGIHVWGAGKTTVLPNSTMKYCFATSKDSFLFKLKF